MSLDRSLKSANNMGGHRNVLTRAERIAKLTSDNRFDKDAHDPIHLPKVGNRKTGGKKKKDAAETAEGAAAPGAAAPAAGAKPAAGAAAAKPAAGAAAKPAGKK